MNLPCSPLCAEFSPADGCAGEACPWRDDVPPAPEPVPVPAPCPDADLTIEGEPS